MYTYSVLLLMTPVVVRSIIDIMCVCKSYKWCRRAVCIHALPERFDEKKKNKRYYVLTRVFNDVPKVPYRRTPWL